MPKGKKSIATVAVLALAASTALRFHLAWYIDEWQDESIEYHLTHRRRLSAQQQQSIYQQRTYNFQGPVLYQRIHSRLVSRGMDPKSPEFKRLLREIMAKRSRELRQKRDAQERRVTLETLKETKNVWHRGDYLNTWQHGIQYLA